MEKLMFYFGCIDFSFKSCGTITKEELSDFMKVYNVFELLEMQRKSRKPRVVKTSKGKLVLSSMCVLWDSKKSKFIKKQEPIRLLRNLGLKIPSSKIPLLHDVFLKV